jgi:formylglycine-generating enzyme required for sulfatase activity
VSRVTVRVSSTSRRCCKTREAEREYQPIVALIKHDRTRKHGCEAFVAFRQQFPNYDPENLSSICATAMLPMLEWCAVPEGAVTMTYEDRKVIYALPPFRISKYPITNAQYQVFIDAPDGYCEPRWWAFSDDAKTWHSQHPDPLLPRFNWGDHPRANVCWFEAMAFCHWLSARSGLQVTLPTEQQWQRAAQGDDGRPYPWGTKFDKARANTKEAFLRMTTSVTRFPNGVSPFGLLDMAGNVWEWCGHVNGKRKPGEVQMPVRGGSFMSVAQRSRIDFRFMLSPVYRYASIGFRVVCRAG